MRSPRESELYLLLVLERSRGGFGLARPSVNASVPVAGTIAEALTRASRFEVDLVWEDERVVLEYDGLEEHEADPAKVAEDKERRSVLAAMGYTVIVVTGRDFASEVSMRAKVAQVALALGISIDPFDETETAAHTALFNWLTNPRHDHVPLGCGFH